MAPVALPRAAGGEADAPGSTLGLAFDAPGISVLSVAAAILSVHAQIPSNAN
jgi:hypothetical protein